MSHYKLAFLGFGNVGKAFAELLLNKQAEIQAQHGIIFSVVGITTGRHGMVIDPNGIDLLDALKKVNAGECLSPSSNPQDFIKECTADILFESIPVNYQSGQPAVDLIHEALESEMHVVTANKGPVVHAYRELTDLAEAKGRKFFFESAVMDGAPVFALFRETLPVANLLAFRGVLNSTTNLLLTLMEEGQSFEKAVAYAQSIGIAETDPSGDIDGWDAAIKVCALTTVLMGIPLQPGDVDRTGIRGISQSDIAEAKAEGKRWKLVCEAIREQDFVRARVAPQKVSVESPLYGVMGTTSIIEFESDVLGKLSLIESDPSPYTTAYGMLADFINAVK
ncbi:MAG: homoserine dehydrogenase [Anaerolineales bacterium]|nr:homoserine dehydrogenase [Chloroflexota bacterium]MBL6980619.1 homoserine dehydrogenase [Anaerolineales bacterium]